MIKDYYQYLTEAKIERDGQIKFSFTGGGLKEPAISFETDRNPDSTGSVSIELYSKGGTEYKFTPPQEIKVQMDIINGMTGDSDESRKAAEETVVKLIKQKQEDLNADLLQVFTQFDEEVKQVLKKHNIE